jgi:hypothetical protein
MLQEEKKLVPPLRTILSHIDYSAKTCPLKLGVMHNSRE